MRHATTTGFVLTSLIALASCAPAGDAPKDAPEPFSARDIDAAATAIDEQTILGTVAEISSDAYRGRGPATEGDRMTRAWLAARLEEYGFEPGGPDGTWEQPMEIVGLTARMPETWTFEGPSGTESFRWWDEYIASSGEQSERASIDNAEVVFVGYGIDAPEERWDDYKGVDLAGKVLLMLNNDPSDDPSSFAGDKRLYYGRWTYKYQVAAEKGAAGAIVIHTNESAGYPWGVVQTGWTGEQFELPAGDEPRVRLTGWLTRDAAGRLAALAGHDLDALIAAAQSRDFAPVPLGVTTSIAFETELTRKQTANVLGLLRGSDPELASQAVIYTAHHDHLGVGEPDESGDAIYNGAVDNAAGSGQVLAIARAFAALPRPPRRSVLALFVAAEEQGLLGSRFYAAHPTFHPGRIAANINIDGGNIWGRTSDVAVIGRGKSTLEDLLAQAAKTQGRVVVDEPFPDKGYYYRSDQLNFARIGVPALYFKPGTSYRGRPEGWGAERTNEWTNTRYHQPSDELEDDWNFEGMIEDARLAFRVGLAAAESDSMPAWRPGDEFEAARRRALAGAGE